MAQEADLESFVDSSALNRKPVNAGLNSRQDSHADSQQDDMKQEHQSPKPTNRDRYENKPMPKLPKEATENDAKVVRKPYIKPVIPLVDPNSPPKSRAVTEPLLSRTLFANKRPAVTQLQRKFGHSKQASGGESKKSVDGPPATGKAAQILGFEIEKSKPQHSARHSPTLADSEESSPDLYHGRLAEAPADPSNMSATTSHNRDQSQATIKQRMVEEVVPEVTVTSDKTTTEDTPKERERLTTPTNLLAPPKIASYGKIGDRGLIHNHGLVRVESVQGIIEHTNRTDDADGDGRPIEHARSFEPQQINQSASLPPITNLTSSYEGIWENDPAVGYSLPLFSPMPRTRAEDVHGFRPRPLQLPTAGPSQHFDTRAPYTSAVQSQPTSAATSSFYRQDRGNEAVHRQSNYVSSRGPPDFQSFRPYPGSTNSWATNPKSSPSSATPEPISALLPPYWPNHNTNSVPSPPHTYQNYERPGSLSAGLSHLDMTIHHHLDTGFKSMRDHVTMKSDKVLDLVLRRLDGLDDVINKSFKTTRAEVKDVYGEVLTLKAEMSRLHAQNELITGHVNDISERLIEVERMLAAKPRVIQDATGIQSESESRPSTRDRAGSATGTLSSSEPPRRHSSRAASKVRSSRASHKSQKSIMSVSQPSNGVIDKRHDHYAAFITPREPAPDLRRHPAYAGIPQPNQPTVDQNGNAISSISFTGSQSQEAEVFGDNGWYQQAYGTG